MVIYIILNYNDYKTTIQCIENVKKYTTIVSKIIIVDNCSTDESFYELCKLNDHNIEVIKSSYNGGYGAGNNFGIQYAIKKYNAKHIIISNPDVYIEEKAIKACYDFLRNRTDTLCTVPLMLDKLEKPYYGCVWRIPTWSEYLFFSLYFGKNISFRYDIQRFNENSFECDCVAGSWLMIDVDKFSDIGMYDENVFLYCEETLIGLKAKQKNYKSFILPQYNFVHLHSVSISKSIKSVFKQQRIMWKSRLYVLSKYYKTNIFYNSFAYFISRLALLEIYIIGSLRKLKDILFC